MDTAGWTFTPTHVVPRTGLPTWAAPDAAEPPGPSLAARLEVQLLQTTPTGWAWIACSNGWTAWVDASRLEAPGLSPARAGRLLRSNVALGGLSLVGGAVIALAAFLPWFSAGGESVSGWDVALHYVVFGTGDGTTGIGVGLPLVLAGAVVAVLVATRQPVPMLAAMGLAAAGSWAGTFALARVLRPDPHPNLGAGAVVALAGAALIGIELYRTAARQMTVGQ